jgi:prepilin-type N-terminal cleavage/methylation domain-containing protein/prepilin-type processing-associated H-X9-DG protein
MNNHLMHRLRFRGTPRAFTLVELLVVLAIIAMLASLLMPAVQSGIQKAKGTKCSGNLRQIGIAVLQYVADPDNGHQYPPIYNTGSNNAEVTAASSDSPLQPLQYLSNYGVTMALLTCPSDSSPDTNYGSYLWSPILQGEQPENVHLYTRGGAFMVNRMASLTICSDKGMPHLGKINVLRADGHVDTKP